MTGTARSLQSPKPSGWSGIPLRVRLPALIGVGLIGVAAVVRPAAPIVFLVLLFAYFAARLRGTPSIAAAAVLPAAAILVWRSIGQPLADPGGADCASLLSPPAIWRFFEAAIALLVLLYLVFDRRATLAELGFRQGSRRVRLLAIVGLVALAPIAMYAGTLLGDSPLGAGFFGAYQLDLSQAAAIAPALLFAGSNALAEELAYRGAMRTWLAPSLGIVGANVAQAVVFGLAHTGEDFVGIEAVIPTMLAMIIVGFIGGVIARRTGSLTLLLAVHAAADIPIYFYWACRLG